MDACRRKIDAMVDCNTQQTCAACNCAIAVICNAQDFDTLISDLLASRMAGKTAH